MLHLSLPAHPPHSAIITSSFALHIVVMPGYVGRTRTDADGLGWQLYSWLSLALPYCLITPRSSSFSCLGGIFSVHSVGGSVQPSSARSPGAEIVRILAPIFPEQIALVRSTTLYYGAVPSSYLPKEIFAVFVRATHCNSMVCMLNCSSLNFVVIWFQAEVCRE